MELSTARIFVRDIAEARSFYADILGLPLKADRCEEGFCVFTAGAAILVVQEVSNDAPEDELELVGRFTGLSFTVTDVPARHAELTARGAVFTVLPEAQPWGGVLATLCDPSGNELQIVQYPEA
ncbi:VOC family protein [Paludibacterium paludis]|uniref:VOC domain-containing protein n=1 Tax=Paludibacterium paludis TaxID=1225769 RepID=A0A918P396_9NEIS|nr:VOC family protein [Paludibacterium paludis]GGY14063.1 hypothetical protein GCM10011289_16770 [Paludibacterium paludis]